MQCRPAIRPEIFLADDVAPPIVLIAEPGNSFLVDDRFIVNPEISHLDQIAALVVSFFRAMPATLGYGRLAAGVEVGLPGFVPPWVVFDEPECIAISSVDGFAIFADACFFRAGLQLVIFERQRANAAPPGDLIPI